MALALYRKYRPATFAEVVGQEHVTEPLRKALESGRINHAYLFSGPRGCGKTSSARILARSLNCVNGPTPDPCGTCSSCIGLAPEGPGSLDVVELDAASHGGVDDTRELRDRAFYMPAESRYRVFIIDEAHMVSKQGFNALLKTVEEPPEHLVFIFATTEPDKVLPTIRSRTHHYPFRLLPPATLRGLLEKLCGEEGVSVEPAVFPLVVQAGAGSARDALSVMDQLLAGADANGVTYANAVSLLGVTDGALLDEMVDALAASDGASVFGAVERVAEAGHDPRRFGADLLQRLRDLVIFQAVPDAVSKGLIDAPDDQLAAMTAQADRLPTATLTRFAEIVHVGLTDMRGTTSPRMVLELLCARMLLPAASLDDAGLLQRLERLERRLDIASGNGSGAGAAIASGAASGQGPRDDEVRAVTPERQSTASVGQPPAPAQPTSSARPSAPAQPPASEPEPQREEPARDNDLGLPAPPVLSSDRAAPVRETAPEPASAESAAAQTSGHPPRNAPDRAPENTVEHSPVQPAESSATDAIAPAAQPQGSVGITDVRRVWTEILAAVKQHRRTTQVLLESATVAELVQGTLLLTMPSPALARRVSEPGNTDVLRAALHEMLGVDWRIQCEAGEASSVSRGSSGDISDISMRAAPSASAADSRQESRSVVAPAGEPVPSTAATVDSAESEARGQGPSASNPDDHVDPDTDASTPPQRAVDRSKAAMELLTDKLGARPLDNDTA